MHFQFVLWATPGTEFPLQYLTQTTVISYCLKVRPFLFIQISHLTSDFLPLMHFSDLNIYIYIVSSTAFNIIPQE